MATRVVLRWGEQEAGRILGRGYLVKFALRPQRVT